MLPCPDCGAAATAAIVACLSRKNLLAAVLAGLRTCSQPQLRPHPHPPGEAANPALTAAAAAAAAA